MIYMLFGDNFWFNPNMEHLIECKKNMFSKYNIPDFIRQMFVYVRNLRFEEEPDYDFLISLLKEEKQNN